MRPSLARLVRGWRSVAVRCSSIAGPGFSRRGCRPIAARASQRIDDVYTWEHITDQYEELFRNVMGAR